MDNYNQPGFGYEQSESTVFGREENEIVVSYKAKQTLLSISKWAKFLAIFSIVMIALNFVFGFLLICGLTSFSSMASGTDFGDARLVSAITGILGFVYIVIAAILLYPSIKMLNYANYMKKAVNFTNQRYYEEALTNINSTLIFLGVLAIISIVLIVLSFILPFLFAAMMSFH